MKTRKLTFSSKQWPAPALMIVLALTSIGFAHTIRAQTALESGLVVPMGKWLEFRDARYTGEPILVHLRTGYERAIVLPEAVVQSDPEQTLQGAEIVIDGNIVAFYPTETFKRQRVLLRGLETGDVYELRVRASTEGLRQPMRVNR